MVTEALGKVDDRADEIKKSMDTALNQSVDIKDYDFDNISDDVIERMKIIMMRAIREDKNNSNLVKNFTEKCDALTQYFDLHKSAYFLQWENSEVRQSLQGIYRKIISSKICSMRYIALKQRNALIFNYHNIIDTSLAESIISLVESIKWLLNYLAENKEELPENIINEIKPVEKSLLDLWDVLSMIILGKVAEDINSV